METIPSLRLGFLRGVFLANHLASTDNLTTTTKRQNTHQHKLTIQKVSLMCNNTMKENPSKTTDRACFSRLLRLQPGNGTGLFLQPRSPHGARASNKYSRLPTVVIILNAASILTQYNYCQCKLNRNWGFQIRTV